MSAEDETRRSELAARHDEIAEQHNGSGDDLPEEVAAELDRVEAELAELEAREEAWQPEDLAIGGVILTIAADGSLRIDRGYVRAEDEPKPELVTPAQDGTEAEDGTTEADSGSTVMPFRPAPEPEDKAPALSATLLAELEVHRTGVTTLNGQDSTLGGVNENIGALCPTRTRDRLRRLSPIQHQRLTVRPAQVVQLGQVTSGEKYSCVG